MTATITNDFKRFILRKVFDDFSNSTNRYFIGIGKGEPWNDAEEAPIPTGSLKEMRDAKATLQSVKSAADVSFVVDRNNWSSGTIYDAWDDSLVGSGSNPFYVVTEELNVYVCIRGATNADGTRILSTQKPTHIDHLKPVTYSDGYKWKYLYTILPANSTAFLSSNFLPVRKSGGSESGLGAQQDAVQAASVRGQILGVNLTEAGAGYSSVPTVTIEGDGTGATATAFVTSGAITHIFIDSDADSGIASGRGYNFAGVKITGGSPSTAARASAVIGDIYGEGIGADPRNDLKSTALMFNTKPNGIESGTFFTGGQDFRQVTLISDPIDSDGNLETGTAVHASKYLVATSTSEAQGFALDATITGGTSGAKALVVSADSDYIFITQNDSTGFASFAAEAISGTASGGGTNNATLVDGIIHYRDVFTPGDSDKGHVLYIDNRAAVIRDNAQTEDLKVVISI